MAKTTGVILSILGGAAAGVIIGMLIAPEKGADTRKKLKRMVADWADALLEQGTVAMQKANEMQHEIQQTDKELEAALDRKS